MKKIIATIIMALVFNTANAYDYNNNSQEDNNGTSFEPDGGCLIEQNNF